MSIIISKTNKIFEANFETNARDLNFIRLYLNTFSRCHEKGPVEIFNEMKTKRNTEEKKKP